MTVVGVDGWKGRWIAAVVEESDASELDDDSELGDGSEAPEVQWNAFDRFADLLDRYDGAVVAVDMPIATTDGPRDVDAAARAWLRDNNGPWQSIFLTPPTEIVAAWELHQDHKRAMAERPPGTPGTSIQAWNLIPAIVQVRDALAVRPGARVVEAHPECSFRALDDRVGRASKKTGLGVGQRLRALRRTFELDLADAPPDVPVDDLLDAAVLAWTAGRYARGEHLTLPDGAEQAPRIVI